MFLKHITDGFTITCCLYSNLWKGRSRKQGWYQILLMSRGEALGTGWLAEYTGETGAYENGFTIFS